MTDNYQQAIVYCRVASIQKTEEGHGLSSQETRCREYAKHKNYELIKVFQDDGVSGNLVERPGMKALLQFLEQEKDNQTIVIIDDISRLARGLTAHLRLRASIKSAGGKLESPSITFAENSDSQLVENLLVSATQHQCRKMTSKLKIV